MILTDLYLYFANLVAHSKDKVRIVADFAN